MTPAALRVLIVDDGALARQRLEDLLKGAPNCTVVASVANGDAAVRAIRELKPDLVFLDVQMPGKNGIEVVEAIGPERMPATIFVTAYDDYALRAFDLAAVDYLLKPFEDERFEQALRRARHVLELQKLGEMAQPLREVLMRLNPAASSGRPEPTDVAYLERLAVEMPGEVRVVPVEHIDYISASGHYADLHVGEKSYVIRERMDTLEQRLDPARFLRVHRSAIVQLDRIVSLSRQSGGDYSIKLRTGAQVAVGRHRVDALEHWLGLAKS